MISVGEILAELQAEGVRFRGWLGGAGGGAPGGGPDGARGGGVGGGRGGGGPTPEAVEGFLGPQILNQLDNAGEVGGGFGTRFDELADLVDEVAGVAGLEVADLGLEDASHGGEEAGGRFAVAGLDVREEGGGFEAEFVGELALGEAEALAAVTDKGSKGFAHFARFAECASLQKKICAMAKFSFCVVE